MQQFWDSFPVGAVMDDNWQTNSFIPKDCTGADSTRCVLTERHFQKVNTSATTWPLQEL